MPRLTVKELRKAVADMAIEARRRDEQLADQEIQLAALTIVANQLTQLAAQQAETIGNLTRRLDEVAEAHNTVAVEMVRAQSRLDHLNYETFTLSESNARRAKLHGAWISELFNRLNDHVNNAE